MMEEEYVSNTEELKFWDIVPRDGTVSVVELNVLLSNLDKEHSARVLLEDSVERLKVAYYLQDEIIKHLGEVMDSLEGLYGEDAQFRQIMNDSLKVLEEISIRVDSLNEIYTSNTPGGDNEN